MIDWINVDTTEINKIGYNSELKIMFIDFSGSIIDIPFQNVEENEFKKFFKAKNIDDYYETHIKGNFEKIVIESENKISCNIGYS